MSVRSLVLLLGLTLLPLAWGLCPFGGGGASSSSLPAGHPQVYVPKSAPVPSPKSYYAALQAINFDDVKADLKVLFTNSQDFWPADFGNYGPFFIRLAWHCAGSYRLSDGRGGCEGGRQRFDPERSWDDNTNLDKARHLLWPIKEKYGLGLSWGDLIILAGTTAIESMGGPVLGFCGGRIDDQDGSASLELGPTPEQQEFGPCPVNGQCARPLGSTTVGLIYVNPAGPMGQPIPEGSAVDIRDTFARMGMNDSETVALIAGGHTFGKTHGACPAGPGPSPKEDPFNPWPGMCGTGKGKDAFTSGFEVTWTTTPTQWSNEYLHNLLNYEWEVYKGPGGQPQWRPANSNLSIRMLTSDLGLMNDVMNRYQQIVKEFANDFDAFDDAFAHAWYKLVTRDMGPVTRCTGNHVPPPQPWQYPLPPTPAVLANFTQVAADIATALATPQPNVLPPDVYNGQPNYGPLFVRLAWQCASTFRATDYQGGCNGARIRFRPQIQWPVNQALDSALLLLQPIKDKYGNGLSWADMIVLAGNVAIQQAGGPALSFCGGRTDAEDGAGSENLYPFVTGNFSDSIFWLKQTAKIMGLSNRELTALIGGGHALGQMHANRTGYTGAHTPNPSQLSNAFFTTLLNEDWQEFTVSDSGLKQYKAVGKELYMLRTDLMLRVDDELSAVAQEYAVDNETFLKDFAAAWTKLMNADRFSPSGNVCDQ